MVEQVLITTGVVALLVVVGLGAAATVAVRRMRRRYRAARLRMLGPRSTRATRPDAAQLPRGSVAVSTLGSPGWWAAQRHRHRMWQAVSSAEHAVGVAQRADVAVGDLPALVARLHTAAAGADAVLRAGSRQGALRDQDRLDCARIVDAAHDLQRAALGSLRSGFHADTDSIVSAVRIEVAALASGIRAAHG